MRAVPFRWQVSSFSRQISLPPAAPSACSMKSSEWAINRLSLSHSEYVTRATGRPY